MERDLNSRQLRFATLVASGKHSLVSAFRETYAPSRPKARHVYRNARRLSRHPVVAAKIRELQQQLWLSPEDAEEMQNRALAVAYHLSIDATSDRVRLAAAMLLFEASEKLQAARDGMPQQEGRALTELRRLYRRMTALSEKEDPVSRRTESGKEQAD